MKFLEKVKTNEKELITHTQELLRINSTLEENLADENAPFGVGIKKSLDYVLDLGRSFGFKVENIDNLAGHIEYGEGEEIIGVLCHIDVVPAVGKWKYPPFSATIADGKIYARGAIDDKGPTMAALYALKILKDLNIKLKKRVRLIIGTDEETNWRCMDAYFKKCEMPSLGFSPDANFPVIYGEKGIMSIDLISKDKNDLDFRSGDRYNVVPEVARARVKRDLRNEFKLFLETNKFAGESAVEQKLYGNDESVVEQKLYGNDDSEVEQKLYGNDESVVELKLYGKSAHAMQPEVGVNAAVNLAKFLKDYTNSNLIKFVGEKLIDTRFETLGLNFSDPEMKDLTVNVAIVEVNKEGGKIGLNLRYPINWDKEGFLNKLEEQASLYNLEVLVKEDKEPHYVAEDDELVQTLHNAYIKYTNDHESKNITIGGGTYARALKKGVAFGALFPGREDVVHQVDEHIYIEDLILATAIYTKAIYDLGK